MLVPYSTEREMERTPWATIALIGANVAVAGITFARPDVAALLAVTPEAFHWWQPLTAMFTHAGIEHLLGNMVLLWVFGSHVEDTIGIPKYLLLYFSAGVAADVLQLSGDLVMLGAVRGGLGASGCIMGLVSIFATRYRRVKVNIFYLGYFRAGTWQVDAIYVAAAYLVLDLVFGSLGFFGADDGVAHFAHLGGFAAGIGWAYGLKLVAEAAKEEASAHAAEMASAGAYSAAGAEVEAALTKRPGDPDLHKEAAAYFGLESRTYSRAVHHWSQALRLWLARGQRDKAVEEWAHAKSRYGVAAFDPSLVCDMGVALEAQGRFEEAVEAYEAAARHREDAHLGPTSAMRMARLLERMGHDRRACEWYAYVVDAWPESQETLDAGERARHFTVGQSNRV